MFLLSGVGGSLLLTCIAPLLGTAAAEITALGEGEEGTSRGHHGVRGRGQRVSHHFTYRQL